MPEQAVEQVHRQLRQGEAERVGHGGIHTRGAIVFGHEIRHVGEAETVLAVAPAERAAQSAMAEAVLIELEAEPPARVSPQEDVLPNRLIAQRLVQQRGG